MKSFWIIPREFLLKDIPSNIIKEFEEKGIIYHRTMLTNGGAEVEV